MNKGKNFNLFLMDGEVTGRIKCTLANWTGIAYKIPRSYLDRCKERTDLKQSGVYFLFGKNDADEEAVYIGQAGIRKNGEGVLFRVAEHLKEEFYFTDAIMLTTQNNSFGPTEISYLENRFTKMAIDTDRYKVRNGNEPNQGNVTEEKESELEDFVEYSKMVLGVLGYKVFVPLVKPASTASLQIESNEDDELALYIYRRSRKSNKTIEAKCIRTSEGFVLLKGSNIVVKEAQSTPKSIKLLREKCMHNGEIVDGVLNKNQLFTSPSSLAAFVLGISVNGKEALKNAEGIALKDLEQENK